MTTVPSFNPYREWLGIETAAKPTYYQLLGLPRRESDPEERNAVAWQTEAGQIRQAAHQLIQRLEQLDTNGRDDLRDQLIRRIERAAHCLTDSQMRGDYDRRLARDVAAKQARQQVPTYAKPKRAAVADGPAGNPAKTIVAPPPNTASSSQSPSETSRPRRVKRAMARGLKKQHRRRNALLISLSAGGISVLGITYLLVTHLAWSSHSQPSAETTLESAANGTPSVPTLAQQPADHNHPPFSTAGSTKVPAPSVVPIPERRPSIEELNRLGEALRNAKQALCERQIQRAHEFLEQAKKLAKLPQHHALCERLVALTQYVDGYWKAAADGLRAIQAGEELSIDDTLVFVVEKTATTLTLRKEGRNITYQLAELPIELERYFADRWFDSNESSTKVFRGAMMAVSQDFTPDEARQLWREAQSTGVVDLGDLELVLEDSYEFASDGS